MMMHCAFSEVGDMGCGVRMAGTVCARMYV